MGVTHIQYGHLVRPKRDWFQFITATETLVILSVIILLAAVLVPTIRSQLTVTNLLQARYEAEQLHVAFMRFYHDTGYMPGARRNSPNNARRAANTGGATILISKGRRPTTDDPNCTGWLRARTDWIDANLVDNKPDYPSRDDTGYGWNGPYLDFPIGPDPWGNSYMVNIAYFDDSKQTKTRNGKIKRAVFIVSAGPNGQIDTPWSQPITTAQAQGDDITLRLQ